MKHSSFKQLSERVRIMTDWSTRQVSGKTSFVSAWKSEATDDLMVMTTLNAESMQKKLVCCECFQGECNMCGYSFKLLIGKSELG